MINHCTWMSACTTKTYCVNIQSRVAIGIMVLNGIHCPYIFFPNYSLLKFDSIFVYLFRVRSHWYSLFFNENCKILYSVCGISSNSGKAIHSSKNLIQNAGLAYFLFCEGWKMDLWKQGSLTKRDSWSREICSTMFAVRREDLFHSSVVFSRISTD